MVKQNKNEMKNILTSNFNKHYLRRSGNRISKRYIFNQGGKLGDYDLLNAERNRIKIINNYVSPLKDVLTSEPVIKIGVNKVVINIFYYRASNKEKTFNINTMNNLGELLSNVFGRPVELQFIKLKYPYLDRTILAKYIRINADYKTSYRLLKWIMKVLPVIKNNVEGRELELLNKYELPSYVLGIKIIISGRLITERVKERETVKSRRIGSFKHQRDSLEDYGYYTTKNELGAQTVKVWIYQKKLR